MVDHKSAYLLSTSLASIVCVVLTEPIWFINARAVIDKQNRSVVRLVLDTYEKEGVRPFYKGIVFDLIMIVNPVLTFFAYDYLKQYFYANLLPSLPYYQS